jgi:hypothetical protein
MEPRRECHEPSLVFCGARRRHALRRLRPRPGAALLGPAGATAPAVDAWRRHGRMQRSRPGARATTVRRQPWSDTRHRARSRPRPRPRSRSRPRDSRPCRRRRGRHSLCLRPHRPPRPRRHPRSRDQTLAARSADRCARGGRAQQARRRCSLAPDRGAEQAATKQAAVAAR